ncbi:MAG TPA: YaiO family outer membrane beta-barrel protein [Desulfuromonadales bacterium]|nr:YaiO family outer membrane beta-barrel protein [Desulfuromonadales bacterium]
MDMRVVLTAVSFVVLCVGFPYAALSAPSRNYNQGIKEAQSAISSGNHINAERILARLNKRYKSNPELLAMHGRVLVWLKRYEEGYRRLQKAYSLQSSASLLAEIERVEALRDVAAANTLLVEGNLAEGEALLKKVYLHGKVRYESGILLARSTFERGAFPEAAEILADLVVRYPQEKDLRPRYVQALVNTGNDWQALTFIDSLPERELDAELLTIRGRLLFKAGDAAGAIRSLRTSTNPQQAQEIAVEQKKIAVAQALQKADLLLAAGDNQRADAFFAELCNNQQTRYEGCRKRAALASQTGNHDRAAALYTQLSALYPLEPDFMLLQAQELVHLQKLQDASNVLDVYPDQNNSTLLSLRGSIALNRKNLDEAIAFYSRAVPTSKDPETSRKLNLIRTTKALETAEGHLVQKEFAAAESLLHDLYRNSSDQYTSGLLLGRTLLAQKKNREAALLYRELELRYPKEPDLTALRVESHLLAREYAEAVAVLRETPLAVKEYLAREREDLLYRSTDNWMKLSGGAYGQSGSAYSTTETNLTLSGSQRVKQFSLTGWTGTTSKFSQTDSQIGLGIAGGKGEKSPCTWEVNFSASPEARIVPRTTIGFELTRGFKSFEASLGYTRMDFTDSSANILIPGILWYIPGTTFTLSERLYFVPDNGGSTFLTTLHHEPSHRLRWYVSLGAGTGAERIDAHDHYLRSQTVSARIGSEYRYTPHYSIGAEGSFETRDQLYDRSGASLFMRYWWQ